MNPIVMPPPSSADKVRRGVWNIVWLVLFRPSPVPMHGWRCALLRLFGANIGKGVHPYPSARIWAPWNLTMGDGSCLGLGSDTYNVEHVRVGAGAVVSQKAYLCSASHDIDQAHFPLTAAPISIGAGAWVAAAAFVGPGVTIGEGAVVGAATVVTKDVEPWAVVVGNPAAFVRFRKPSGQAPDE